MHVLNYVYLARYTGIMTMISRNKEKDIGLDFTFFLSVLKFESWLGILGFMVCSIFALWVFECMYRKSPGEGLLGSALALVGGAMIQRDCQPSLQSKLSRGAFLAISFGGFLIYSVYTATLTSMMVARPNSVSFTNFEEFLASGFSITVLGNSANFDFFKVIFSISFKFWSHFTLKKKEIRVKTILGKNMLYNTPY